MSETTSILRRTLSHPHTKFSLPDMTIGRWTVYALAESAGNKDRRYFEIAGNKYEKILIVILLNENNEVSCIKYYYLLRHTDQELAFLLTQALISKILIKFNWVKQFELKELKF